MKCGVCHRPLPDIQSRCDCNQDPWAGFYVANRYTLLGKLAEGGMGIIYRALREQETERTLCAIKISRWGDALRSLRRLTSEQAQAEELARIQREFTLLQKAASQSRHVVQVYDQVFEHPTIGLFYPMEFLEGQPISSLPDWGIPFDPQRALKLMLQLCEGIGVAHGLGVVHRDLNAENVFLVREDGEDEFVKLIDFGIARDLYARRKVFQTGDDMGFGHLQYLAPEQVGFSTKTDSYDRSTAAALDHRADIYSLGVLFFEMLTGYPLFDETTIEELANRDWYDPPRLEHALQHNHLPENLHEIVSACVEPDPEHRPSDIYVLNAMLSDRQHKEIAISELSYTSAESYGLLSDDFASSLTEALEEDLASVSAMLDSQDDIDAFEPWHESQADLVPREGQATESATFWVTKAETVKLASGAHKTPAPLPSQDELRVPEAASSAAWQEIDEAPAPSSRDDLAQAIASLGDEFNELDAYQDVIEPEAPIPGSVPLTELTGLGLNSHPDLPSMADIAAAEPPPSKLKWALLLGLGCGIVLLVVLLMVLKLF